MSLYCRGVWGSRTPPWLSFALRFRLFQLSGHCIRATPAVFPAAIRGHPIVRLSSADHRLSSAMLLTIQCSRASCYAPYSFIFGLIAATIAVHQSSHEVLHIDFRCRENDTIILVITKAHTVHYQNQCNLVLYALRLPLY